MNDAWATMIGAADLVKLKFTFVWGAIKADTKTAIKTVLDTLGDLTGMLNLHSQKELKQILVKLGWERYDGDLWRHSKSGVIVGFLDAVAMELRTSIQERKTFEGHFFKEP